MGMVTSQTGRTNVARSAGPKGSAPRAASPSLFRWRVATSSIPTTLSILALALLLPNCESKGDPGDTEPSVVGTQHGNSVALSSGLSVTAVNVSFGYQYDVLRGTYESTYERWLLFSDGSIYFAIPRIHLDDFDISTSKTQHPSDWGQWKYSGTTLVTLHNDSKGNPGTEWHDHENWFELVVATAGDRLDGTYNTQKSSSSSTGETEFFATGWKQVQFSTNGAFHESSGGSVANGSRVTASSNEHAGTYDVTGSEISFVFRSGEMKRNSLFYSSSEKKIIFINGIELIRT